LQLARAWQLKISPMPKSNRHKPARVGCLDTEADLKTEQLEDVCSTVGNLIRIAAVVELEEAVAACEAAEHEPLQISLLDPRKMPASSDDDLRNRRLLEAFAQFRWHIEMIRKGD